MKAFVSAMVALVVIGGGAWAILNNAFDFSAQTRYQTDTPGAVRLSPSE
ncbi:hypothetical protein [Stappia sp.]